MIAPVSMPSFSLRPVGDCGVLAVFGQKVDEEINARVTAADRAIRQADLPGICETVPSVCSLLVRYDPLRTDYTEVSRSILRLERKLSSGDISEGRIVEIPVCYGGLYGEDLPFVAQHAGLSEKDVITIHSDRVYRIFMLGFLPGFPYLGGLDERIHTPRLANPRIKIPAGSVGIGGEQTGIYPLESPGGWQLIGRTPLRLFNADQGDNLPYRAGDRIRFVPIDEKRFLEIEKGQGDDRNGD